MIPNLYIVAPNITLYRDFLRKNSLDYAKIRFVPDFSFMHGLDRTTLVVFIHVEAMQWPKHEMYWLHQRFDLIMDDDKIEEAIKCYSKFTHKSPTSIRTNSIRI